MRCIVGVERLLLCSFGEIGNANNTHWFLDGIETFHALIHRLATKEHPFKLGLADSLATVLLHLLLQHLVRNIYFTVTGELML